MRVSMPRPSEDLLAYSVGSGSVLEEELGHKLGCPAHHCCCCHRPHHPPHGHAPPHSSGFVSYLAQAAGHNAVMAWVKWVGNELLLLMFCHYNPHWLKNVRTNHHDFLKIVKSACP